MAGVTHFLGIVVASYIFIAAKAFQQLNVVHDYKLLVGPTTCMMAVCEVTLIGNIAIQATEGSWITIASTILAMTVGSWAGAVTSMILHKRMRG